MRFAGRAVASYMPNLSILPVSYDRFLAMLIVALRCPGNDATQVLSVSARVRQKSSVITGGDDELAGGIVGLGPESTDRQPINVFFWNEGAGWSQPMSRRLRRASQSVLAVWALPVKIAAPGSG